MEDAVNEWINEAYGKHGLVGLVLVKGFEPSYYSLVDMLDSAGVKHGLDGVSREGLGQHIETIFTMACDGYTSSDIAATLGVKTKTLSRYCSRHGIELQKPLKLSDIDSEVRSLAQKLTVPELAAELGFSVTAVRQYCKSQGIKAKSGKPGYYHKSGYKLVRMPNHPRANQTGFVREHRLVVEEAIGRHLEPDEIVHHKNGDKSDNRLENLEIMTVSEHAKHHVEQGDCGWGLYHKRNGKKI